MRTRPYCHDCDDIITDIGGAAAAGLSGILVRTGKFRQEALESAPVIPKKIISSIAELPASLLQGALPGSMTRKSLTITFCHTGRIPPLFRLRKLPPQFLSRSILP